MLDGKFKVFEGRFNGMKFRTGPSTMINMLDEDSIIPARTIVHFDTDDTVLATHSCEHDAIAVCPHGCRELFDTK